MASGVRVEGLNKLIRDLVALGVEVDDLKDAFSAISREASDAASSFAPKRTGRLAGTIRGNRAKNKAVVSAGRASVRYAGAINYGWPKRNIPASSFMQKADEAMRERTLVLIEQGLDEAIRRRGL